MDGSLIPVERSFPMPKDVNARARVLIQKLLEEYAAPKSTHPIANASGIDEVFLMPVAQQKDGNSGQGQMAVVNLKKMRFILVSLSSERFLPARAAVTHKREANAFCGLNGARGRLLQKKTLLLKLPPIV